MTLGVRLLLFGVWSLALSAACFLAGDHYRDNAWVAKQSKAALLAMKKFDAEVVRGQGAVDDLSGAQSDLQTRYDDLERKLNDKARRLPLVADCNVDPHPKAGDLAGPGLIAPTIAAAPAAAISVPGAVVRDPVLSNAAVWMWDSALAGADLSTSACGSDETTDGACAAPSGITVRDAWENHEVNAKSCAVDRLNFQKLIDFLKGKTQ